MKIHNMEQGSPEWFKVRQLKMTASKAQAIANQGTGLKTLVEELVADYFSSAEKENITNEHIERGNELESEARGIYQLEIMVNVDEIGFVEHNKYVGVSPDGVIGDEGLLEIKCPSDKNFVKQIISGTIPSEYRWQMQMQMLVTGRKWCDYMIYNPNFKRDYVITRVKADPEAHNKLKGGFKLGEELIIKAVNKMKEKNNV